MGKRKTKKKKAAAQEISPVSVRSESTTVQYPDKRTLSHLIEEAVGKTPESSRNKLREYLLEETYFIIGTGVRENVIERLISRTINIFNVFQEEDKKKGSGVLEVVESSQKILAEKVEEEKNEQEVILPETQKRDDVFDKETVVDADESGENEEKKLLDILYTQKARSSHAVAIDISDHSVEILQLDTDRHVIAQGRALLERGVVEDGEILKREDLVQTISKLFTETRPHFINTKQGVLTAALSFPESKTFIHRVVLSSDVEKKDLENEVCKEVSRFIPFLPEDLLWDYRILSEDKGKIEVLYVGIVRILVEEYRSVLKEAGVKLVLVDTELSSVGRLFLSDEDQGTGVVIVDIGARTTGIGGFDENAQLVFSILIPYGGNHMTEEIVRQLHLTYQEAEDLKRTHGFDTSRGRNDVTPLLKKHFEKNIKGIKKALLHYENQTGEKIKKIILAGGVSLLPGIDVFLSEELQILTVRKDSLFYIKKPYYIDDENSILYANVIGLALRVSCDVHEGTNLLKGEKGLSLTKHNDKWFGLMSIHKKKEWIFAALGIAGMILFLSVFFII